MYCLFCSVETLHKDRYENVKYVKWTSTETFPLIIAKMSVLNIY